MIVIFRGISGSYKSTFANILVGNDKPWEKFPEAHARRNPESIYKYIENLYNQIRGPHREVCSADDFFINQEGKYEFDPGKLPEAHAACLRKFIQLTSSLKNHLIVVDNTNCSIHEVAPYVAIGQAYKQDVKIITLIADPAECAGRNVHGVPVAGLIRQDKNLKASMESIPPWWSQEVFHT